jgi:phosphoribosylanthranilate isomerase
MSRTRIKICGIRTAEDALAAATAGADAVGFNFIRGSARFIEPGEAWKIVGMLPPLVSSVGVFANASLDTFSDIEETCPTTYSQLQGSESETLVRECGPNVIKGLRYDAAMLSAELDRWDRIDEVDAILIELPADQQIDLAALARQVPQLRKPVFLGGALALENVGEIVRAVHPYGVDASAGVERERGIKDPALIEAFCRAVQQADAEILGG